MKSKLESNPTTTPQIPQLLALLRPTSNKHSLSTHYYHPFNELFYTNRYTPSFRNVELS
jgi:hypothetical protein